MYILLLLTDSLQYDRDYLGKFLYSKKKLKVTQILKRLHRVEELIISLRAQKLTRNIGHLYCDKLLP